ncbi:hypothetical protein [Bordetella bronchialis]|uniref:DUF551 domain-containing protein n=1 Tax=Bordetella bronchialis TaxID=463025 RepID=A0A193FUT4_9BORD|nr:hypothetical protein [Bordetella bronchialis]ANN71517.1 hypothetical protein BAU08_09375 [Bordetella bronchialis]
MTTQDHTAALRERFEAWFRDNYHGRLDRNMPDRSYNDPTAHMMWTAVTALAQPQQPKIDVEHLIRTVLPGWYICDPQAVADDLRRYFDAWEEPKAIAWKTTHKSVCPPITEDKAIADAWREAGYPVVELFGQPQQPAGWRDIETAPKNNKRPLYLARFDAEGRLVELDFDGSWEYWEESWEMQHINGYTWVSNNGIEDPTHWAYQDEPIPTTAPAAQGDERAAFKAWYVDRYGRKPDMGQGSTIGRWEAWQARAALARQQGGGDAAIPSWAPERIYLIETGEGVVWCDCPSPAPDIDQDDAVEYVRAARAQRAEGDGHE